MITVFNARTGQTTTREPREDEVFAPTLAQRRAIQTCSPFQGKMALLAMGRATAVRNWIEAQDEERQLQFDGLKEWRRGGAFMEALKDGLNLTEAQLDTFYAAAMTIVER
jgi:hypothetical protein